MIGRRFEVLLVFRTVVRGPEAGLLEVGGGPEWALGAARRCSWAVPRHTRTPAPSIATNPKKRSAFRSAGVVMLTTSGKKMRRERPDLVAPHLFHLPVYLTPESCYIDDAGRAAPPSTVGLSLAPLPRHRRCRVIWRRSCPSYRPVCGGSSASRIRSLCR